jgi:hypothetical protein
MSLSYFFTVKYRPLYFDQVGVNDMDTGFRLHSSLCIIIIIIIIINHNTCTKKRTKDAGAPQDLQNIKITD